ncbi:MAG: helix-turn-helix domain-containing protein [Wolinella sp.]
MDKKELAERIGISHRTIYNWEKEKPELIKLINLGLQLEAQIMETEKYLNALKEIQKKADGRLIV